MKNKWLWITIIVILVIVIIGCATNWFGLGKKSNQTIASRIFENNTLSKQSCPEGYSLYTNALNGHSICVKLATGEIKETIKK